jgi:hypothetical protein
MAFNFDEQEMLYRASSVSKYSEYSKMQSSFEDAGKQINDLLAAHNATLGLVKTLNYPDDTYIMQRSHSALQGVVARFAEVGRYVLRGSEMAALNEMISLHDEFLDHVTVRQMEEALAYIKRNTHTAVRLT